MSWEEATHAWAEQNGPDDGFYVQVGGRGRNPIGSGPAQGPFSPGLTFKSRFVAVANRRRKNKRL